MEEIELHQLADDGNPHHHDDHGEPALYQAAASSVIAAAMSTLQIGQCVFCGSEIMLEQPLDVGEVAVCANCEPRQI